MRLQRRDPFLQEAVLATVGGSHVGLPLRGARQFGSLAFVVFGDEFAAMLRVDGPQSAGVESDGITESGGEFVDADTESTASTASGTRNIEFGSIFTVLR
ncbi:MAG: hypothetical protein QOK02_2882 [Mycobacterium sp.]|nr:hypothetical protein [Mycobacterium sp.]